MEKEEFRRHGYEFIDWLADYFEQVEEYPVKSTVKPGEIKGLLSKDPPGTGEPMEKIFNDFKETIIPGITHWQHPGWFAYFPANNSPASVLAELLTAGLGVQSMIWQTSPAAAELEEVVMQWLARMLGLPGTMSGVIQDTASTATLCALLTAREKATGFEANRAGLKQPLRVYASEEGHSSIDKAVKIAGYGIENLRRVPTDERYALVPGELERAVNEDKRQGLEPACVVATVGSTSSAAVDPLKEIGEICNRYNLWFHVDAAYGGTAALLPEKRWTLGGVEAADSFVFNPHKWMLTNFDCSAYFVKDEELLTRTFEIHPEYLKTGYDAVVKNYRDWGIQLGRRFRALKLWFVIRSYGIKGLQDVIREHIRLAETFKSWVEEDERFELMAPVDFSLVCFRFKKKGVSEDELNRLNKLLLEKVNGSGRVFLTHTSLNGSYVIRISIGQRTTTEKNVREAWDLIKSFASSL